MDEAETMFTSQPDWDQWCLRSYADTTSPSSAYTCVSSLSALNAFKASSWNQTLVLDIEGRLDNPVPNVTVVPRQYLDAAGYDAFTGREVYQMLGFCTMFGVGCDVFTTQDPFNVIFTAADVAIMKEFARQMDKDFAEVTGKWDGMGSINAVPEDVSLLCGYMKEVRRRGGEKARRAPTTKLRARRACH